jgi:hypothetical protein
MLNRPFLQCHRDIVAAFEGKRPFGLRQFDRAGDEMLVSACFVKGLLAVAMIEDDAKERQSPAASRAPP